MAQSNIEWTDYTINPGIYGCSKASPACTNCYAMGMAKRLAAMGQEAYQGTTDERGQWTGRVTVDYDRIGPAFATLPKRKPGFVFLTSMADLFHEDVPTQFIRDVFGQMFIRPHLTFLVLTKRAERMADWALVLKRLGEQWPSNVWPGTTCESNAQRNRIVHLLRVPADQHFVSYEPALGPLDLTWFRGREDGSAWRFEALTGFRAHAGGDGYGRKVSWVICGGESGRNARPMHPEWARSLRDQCSEAGAPFMFKQWGEWAPLEGRAGCGFYSPDGVRRIAGPLVPDESGFPPMWRVGKKAAGRLLDGVEHNGRPS